MDGKLIAVILAALMVVPVSVMVVSDDSDADSWVSVTFADGDKVNLISGTYQYRVVTGNPGKLTFTNGTPTSYSSISLYSFGGTVPFSQSGCYVYSGSGSVTLEFDKDPRVRTSPGTTPTGHISTHTATAWFSSSIGPGTYSSNGISIYAIEAGSANEQRFLDDIVNQDKPSSAFDPADYGITVITSSHKVLDTDCTLYMLNSNPYGVAPVRIGINTWESPGEGVTYTYIFNVVNDDWVQYYIPAYRTLSITVAYGPEVLGLFMYGSNGSAFYLESGVQYDIDSAAGVNYVLEAYKTTAQGMAEIDITVVGAAAPDNLGTVFAGVCIVICALVFGLLLISGGAPRWSKND